MQKYYAVARGKVPGVYLNWHDCKEQVHGVSDSRYKKFNTLEEALNFIEGHRVPMAVVVSSTPRRWCHIL
jgi:ribonuclease H-related protein